MRPLWYMTHSVVDRMERDPEFAQFVYESEIEYEDKGLSEYADAESVGIVFRRSEHPEWTIVITTNWDRSRTTICFPGEEIYSTPEDAARNAAEAWNRRADNG